ncbi:hypothetical protein CL614_03090 [archaeon]|nr:hypothetical protein [archaeon]
MDNNQEIFNGKTFQDLTKDIYDNVKNKKLQLDLLVQEIHGFITTIDDAILIAPVIKEIMDVSVKNDEHLVKLASVLQRIITKSMGGIDEDSIALTEQEKEELIQTLQETVDEVQRKSDKMDEIKNINKNIIGN